jgi:membrane associated rhomboid family serine protease
MQPEDARRALDQAHQSYNSSVEPRLPRWAPVTCAVLVTAALSVGGYSPSPGWLKALAIAAGVAFALTAAYVVFRSRTRDGISGLRGPAHQRWSNLVTASLAVLVCALASSPDLRWIYMGVGAFAGIYTWWTLRKQVRA